MEKPVRVKIGTGFPALLPMRGLTRAEWAAKLAYERKPASEKTAMAERGRVRFQRQQEVKRKGFGPAYYPPPLPKPGK